MMQLRFAALFMHQWEWPLKSIASLLSNYYEYCVVALWYAYSITRYALFKSNAIEVLACALSAINGWCCNAR